MARLMQIYIGTTRKWKFAVMVFDKFLRQKINETKQHLDNRSFYTFARRICFHAAIISN